MKNEENDEFNMTGSQNSTNDEFTPNKKGGNSKLLYVILVIVLVAVIAVGAFVFFKSENKEETDNEVTNKIENNMDETKKEEEQNEIKNETEKQNESKDATEENNEKIDGETENIIINAMKEGRSVKPEDFKNMSIEEAQKIYIRS